MAVRIAPERIADLTGAEWVDVCQAVEANGLGGRQVKWIRFKQHHAVTLDERP